MENVILGCVDCRNYDECDLLGDDIDICKYHNVRHLLRILKEPCTEHPNIVQDDEDDEVTLGIVHRYQCPDCMKQIEKEINE